MTDPVNTKSYWLMKSEPNVYSAEKFRADKKTLWEGVRNYQARNFMMKDMKLGDVVLFYHSSCENPGIYALGLVSSGARPDPTQFDRKSEYFDEKSTPENPRWMCVEVQFEKMLKSPILLQDIRSESKLKDMILLKASRLSIQPVSVSEAKILMNMTPKT